MFVSYLGDMVTVVAAIGCGEVDSEPAPIFGGACGGRSEAMLALILCCYSSINDCMLPSMCLFGVCE